MAVRGNEDVFRLQITVEDVVLVEVLDGEDNLTNVIFGLLL